VLPDADLDKAVATTIGHRFEIAGQSCAAVKKLYLHKDIEKAFTEKLLAAVDAVEFGDPSRDDTDMGTVIDMAAARTVADRVEATIAKGYGKLLTGGTHDGTVYSPTVISEVSVDAPVISDETFGPI